MSEAALRRDTVTSDRGSHLTMTERERGFMKDRGDDYGKRGSAQDRMTISPARDQLLKDIDAYTAVRDRAGKPTGEFRKSLQIHATRDELWAAGGLVVRENPKLREAANVISVFKDAISQPVNSADGRQTSLKGTDGLVHLRETFGPERHPSGMNATRTLHLDRDKMVERAKTMPEDLVDMTKDFLKSLMMMNGKRMQARLQKQPQGLVAQILGAVEGRGASPER